MAQSHVVSGLVSKRSELAGILEHHQKEITRLSAEVSAIDGAIKVFDPTYRIQDIKSKRQFKINPFFAHGELHKIILEVMRDAEQPIATPDICAQVIDRKGLTLDSEQLGMVRASVSNALNRQSNKGMIRSVGNEGLANVWEVAD